MFTQTVSFWEDWTAMQNQLPARISRRLCVIFVLPTGHNSPGGSATSMDSADTQIMECNNLCRGAHNSTETGKKCEELASREAISQCQILIHDSDATTGHDIPRVTTFAPFKAKITDVYFSSTTVDDEDSSMNEVDNPENNTMLHITIKTHTSVLSNYYNYYFSMLHL